MGNTRENLSSMAKLALRKYSWVTGILDIVGELSENFDYLPRVLVVEKYHYE